MAGVFRRYGWMILAPVPLPGNRRRAAVR